MADKGSFLVSVGVVDKASSQLKAINDQLKKSQAPAIAYRKELDRFKDLSGFDKQWNSLKGMTASMSSFTRSLFMAIPAMGALTGAASIAGLYKLVEGFAQLGTKLLNNAHLLHTSAETLHGLQGAARLAGSSAEALTNGLQNLGEVMQDAVSGRANDVLMLFNAMGIGISKSMLEAKDATEILPQVADRIKDLDGKPILQLRLATKLFGGSAKELLPFLRLGKDGIAQYNKEAEKYGVINTKAAKDADAIRRAQTALSMSFEGLGNSIAQNAGVPLRNLLVWLADLVNANRAVIGTEIGNFFRELKNGMVEALPALREMYNILKTVATTINTVVKGFGGWGNAIRLLEAIIVGRLLYALTQTAIRLAAIMVLTRPQMVPFAAAVLAGLGVASIAGYMNGQNVEEEERKKREQEAAGGDGTGSSDPMVTPGGPMPGGSRSSGGPRPYNPNWNPPTNLRPAGQLPADAEALIRERAAFYGVDADKAVALARVESGGNATADSGKAYGYMQLTEGTAKDLGVNRFDWRQNIDGGVRYLSQLVTRFNGNYAQAMAGYNTGPDHERMRLYAQSGDPSVLFNETQGHLARINAISPFGGGFVGPARVGGGAGGMNGQVQVNVHLGGNVPPGTTATTRSNNPNIVPGRTTTSMAAPHS